MARSVGVGATNRCNLKCPHCYSRSLVKLDLGLPQIETLLERHPDVREMNFGTGESILNPAFGSILELLHSRGVSVGLTSNGLSVVRMDVAALRRLKDVDISLDFPSAAEHDAWRGSSGVFEDAIKALEKCAEAGVKTSIAMALMSVNSHRLAEFRPLLDRFGCALRINIYKPVGTDEFLLNYDQFWNSIRTLADNFSLVSCSEPVLALVVPDMPIQGSPCGNSVRVHPDMHETPCVYLGGTNVTKEEFSQKKKRLPEFCAPCAVHEKCGGGCMGRRILSDREALPDSYCPKANNREIPNIGFSRVEGTDEFIHSSYLCTIIVR